MARDVSRDTVGRMRRPLPWAAAAVLSFTVGSVSSYRGNRASLPYYRAEVIRIAVGWGLVFVVLMAAAALLGLALSVTQLRRRAVRLYPEGAETEVELTEEALVLRRASGVRSIPYADIRTVKPRERVLWIVVSRRPLAEPLPADLLPPAAVDAIRARSRGAVPASTAPAPTGPLRQIVVPQHWASHVAAATVRRHLRRPRFWTRLALGIVVSIPMAVIGGRAWLAVAPVLALLSLAVAFVQTRRVITWALPPGSTTSAEIHHDRVISRSVRWTRDIPLADIRRIDVRGNVVFFEMTTRPPLLALARELVPADLIDAKV
jgi:hypothetical protein